MAEALREAIERQLRALGLSDDAKLELVAGNIMRLVDRHRPAPPEPPPFLRRAFEANDLELTRLIAEAVAASLRRLQRPLSAGDLPIAPESNLDSKAGNGG